MRLQVVYSICLSSMCSHHKIYRPSSNISHACALHARRGQEVSEIFHSSQPPKLVFHCHLSRIWRIKRSSCPVNQWTRERGGKGVVVKGIEPFSSILDTCQSGCQAMTEKIGNTTVQNISKVLIFDLFYWATWELLTSRAVRNSSWFPNG